MDEIIKECNNVHNYKYDYSKFIYTNIDTKGRWVEMDLEWIDYEIISFKISFSFLNIFVIYISGNLWYLL